MTSEQGLNNGSEHKALTEYEFRDPDAPWMQSREGPLYPTADQRNAIRATIHKTLHDRKAEGKTTTVVSWCAARSMWLDAETTEEADYDAEPYRPVISTVTLELSRMLKTEVRMAPNRGLYSLRPNKKVEAATTAVGAALNDKGHI